MMSIQGKTIFATDLDRTLIFSSKKITEEDKEKGLHCVELLDGKEHSYMSNRAFLLLMVLKESALVIPVTSRVQEKYERLQLGDFEWAVVGNGTTILYHGREYDPWDRLLSIEFNKHSDRIEESVMLLNLLYLDGLVYKVGSYSKELIQTARVNSGYESVVLDAIAEINTDNFFTVYLDELNRVIVVPEFAQKEKALEFILSEIKPDKEVKLITAGDGILDLNMLHMSDVSYTQRGCPVEELITFDCQTVSYGVQGVEEMLVSILGGINEEQL